jgi:hypothetical protein
VPLSINDIKKVFSFVIRREIFGGSFVRGKTTVLYIST